MSERPMVGITATRLVLRAGAVASVVAFAVAMLLKATGRIPGSGDAFDLRAVAHACLGLDPWGWATLGVLVVIATPVLALAATGHEHRVAGDRRTAGLSLVVLAILGLSLAIEIGRAHV